MNKKILILMSCSLVVIVAAIAAVYMSAEDTAEPAGGTALPISNPFGLPSRSVVPVPMPDSTERKIILRTLTGQAITAPDPTSGKPSNDIGAYTYYYLTSNQQAQKSNAEFDIVYGTDSSISITLLKEPLGEARLAAELALRKFFPLSNTQLCDLDITVAVPVDVNERYPGANLGLSFCPGAVTLPR